MFNYIQEEEYFGIIGENDECEGTTMKKFIAGVVVGALLMISPQVYSAASSMIGKKVDGELVVKVDGKQIGNAAVVEGKSYLPVRDVANEMGLKIKVTKQEVTLTTNNEQSGTNHETETETEIQRLKTEREETSKKLEQYKGHLEHVRDRYQKAKKAHEDMTARTSDPLYVETTKVDYESAKSGYESLLKSIEDCEGELERIDARLNELGQK